MSNVATILTRKGTDPIWVDADSSVLDALKIMADKNIGSVVVKDQGNYAGIFTERDYSRNVILKGRHSSATKISEVMSTDLPYVQPSDTLDQCMQLMSDKNVKYLPVLVDERMNGIISISDVIRETVIQQKETISHLENYIQG